jgi:hypothetical protein
MQTFTYMWNCRYIQIVKEFLNDKLHSLVAGEDDIAKIGEEPHLCMAMRLVGHTYMPKWHTLAVPECKAWVLGHMDALLSARKAEFILAIAEETGGKNQEEARFSRPQEGDQSNGRTAFCSDHGCRRRGGKLQEGRNFLC